MIDHYNGFVIEAPPKLVGGVREKIDEALARLDDDFVRHAARSPVPVDARDGGLVLIEPELFEEDPDLWRARRAAEEVRRYFIGVDVRPIG